MKNEKEQLTLAILALEEKRDLQLVLLKDQYLETTKSFQLNNIIKNAFDEIADSAEIKNTILENVVGIGTGLLAKKLLKCDSNNATQNYLIPIAQVVITNLLSDQSAHVKHKLEKLLVAYLSYRKEVKKSMES